LTIRRALLWITANVALGVVAAICGAIWLAGTGPTHEFSGATAAGRGGLLPLGTLLLLVAATLLVANLAYVLVIAARRR
jgi:hypothetical protein